MLGPRCSIQLAFIWWTEMSDSALEGRLTTDTLRPALVRVRMEFLFIWSRSRA